MTDAVDDVLDTPENELAIDAELEHEMMHGESPAVIERWIRPPFPVRIDAIDFSTFLTKKSPDFEQGRKVRADYHDPLDDALCASKFFEDVTGDDGQLLGLKIRFEWYREDGSVFMDKSMYKPLNELEVESLLRKRRQRALDYLRARAKAVDLADSITALYAHFAAAIAQWQQAGGDVLRSAIADETDATIRIILDTETPAGITVAAFILHEIGG